MEGLSHLAFQVAYRAHKGKLELQAEEKHVEQLYQVLEAYISEHPEKQERMGQAFAYLFTVAGNVEKAGTFFNVWISKLEQREAYGMAGDAAQEAGLTDRARRLYKQEITRMDKARANGETNEGYYDEMLLKAGDLDALRPRIVKRTDYYIERGWFAQAAPLYEQIGMQKESLKCRKLAEILKD